MPVWTHRFLFYSVGYHLLLTLLCNGLLEELLFFFLQNKPIRKTKYEKIMFDSITFVLSQTVDGQELFFFPQGSHVFWIFFEHTTFIFCIGSFIVTSDVCSSTRNAVEWNIFLCYICYLCVYFIPHNVWNQEKEKNIISGFNSGYT